MIFGHKFDFKNEQVLSAEYASYPSDPSWYMQNKTIEVIYASSYPFKQRFTS